MRPSVVNLIVRSLVSCALIGGALWGVNRMGRPAARQRPAAERPEMVVEVARAAAHFDEFAFETDGVVVPYREIRVAAEVAGKIVYKSPQCRPGKEVARGDVLFRIEPRDFELDLQRITAEVRQAEGNLEELDVEIANTDERIALAKEELEIGRRELKRFVGASNAVFSKQEIDTARRNELQLRNSLQLQQDSRRLLTARQRRVLQEREVALTARARAELELSRCEIRATIQGVVTEDPGELGGFVQRGGELVAIRDTSRMEVRCSLRMKQLQWLWGGVDAPAAPPSIPSTHPLSNASPNPSPNASSNPSPNASPSASPNASPDLSPAAPRSPESDAYVSFEGGAHRLPAVRATIIYTVDDLRYGWAGRLTRLADSSVNQQTRLIPCIVDVEEPGRVRQLNDAPPRFTPPTLLNGMFVKVQLHARPAQPLVRVPVEAVGPGGQIWVVREQQLHRVRTEIVHADDQFVLARVEAGLQPGEQVVISPLVMPTEGADVVIHGDSRLAARKAP